MPNKSKLTQFYQLYKLMPSIDWIRLQNCVHDDHHHNKIFNCCSKWTSDGVKRREICLRTKINSSITFCNLLFLYSSYIVREKRISRHRINIWQGLERYQHFFKAVRVRVRVLSSSKVFFKIFIVASYVDRRAISYGWHSPIFGCSFQYFQIYEQLGLT